MRTISIKQLHAQTGRWVRSAKIAPVTVTDRGEPVALLAPHAAGKKKRPGFALKGRGPRPKIGVDSTIGISADRDRS